MVRRFESLEPREQKPIIGATVVVEDTILKADDNTRRLNEALVELAPTGKITGDINIIKSTQGQLLLLVQCPRPLEVVLHTCGHPSSTDVSNMRAVLSDHAQRTNKGGNAHNTTSHLEYLQRIGVYAGEVSQIPLGFRRQAIQVLTQSCTITIADPFPQDLTQFTESMDAFRNSRFVVADHNLSHLLTEDNMPVFQLNLTTSKRREGGSIAVKHGRAPVFTSGYNEVPDFLRGAMDAYCLQEGLLKRYNLDENSPAFVNQQLRPDILKATAYYGYLYSLYMYGEDSGPELPHDMALSAGPLGGANRMHGMWAFSTPPSNGGKVHQFFQLEHTTDDPSLSNLNTTGGGDRIAAVLALMNAANIPQLLSRHLGKKDPKSDAFLARAELVFASLLMQKEGALVVHTNRTSSDHIADDYYRHFYDSLALQAIRVTKDFFANADLTQKEPVTGKDMQNGISIALLDERAHTNELEKKTKKPNHRLRVSYRAFKNQKEKERLRRQEHNIRMTAEMRQATIDTETKLNPTFDRGKDLMMEEHYEEAAEVMIESLDVHPGPHPYIHLCIARCYRELAKLSEARQHFQLTIDDANALLAPNATTEGIESYERILDNATKELAAITPPEEEVDFDDLEDLLALDLGDGGMGDMDMDGTESGITGWW